MFRYISDDARKWSLVTVSKLAAEAEGDSENGNRQRWIDAAEAIHNCIAAIDATTLDYRVKAEIFVAIEAALMAGLLSKPKPETIAAIENDFRKELSRRAGKESGKKRAETAAMTWEKHAQELLMVLRSDGTSRSQTKEATEIFDRWKLDLELRPSLRTLQSFVARNQKIL